VRRHPKETLDQYKRRAQAIELAHTRLLNGGLQRKGCFPTSGHQLGVVARQVHLELFSEGDPRIAGLFRTGACVFGRGRNVVEGSAPGDIEQQLASFPLRPVPTANCRAVAQWGAAFLHRFFAIHPFQDGNGRVARLLMMWAIQETGTFEVSSFDQIESRSTSRSQPSGRCGRRKRQLRYVEALEFAHRHANWESAPASDVRERAPSDYLFHLTKWLAPLIQELPDAIEEPPVLEALHSSQ
jgi:hypothetical protein